MKKLTTLLLALAMLLCLAACGSSQPSQIDDLFSLGYEAGMSCISDGDLQILLANYEAQEYKTVSAHLSGKEADRYDAIDVFEDDYQTQIRDFLSDLDSITIEDISDLVPTQEELDAYVGMTIGEIEDAGFEQYGYSWGETEKTMDYCSTEIELLLTLDAPTDLAQPDYLSADDLRSYVVTHAEFLGISPRLFD